MSILSSVTSILELIKIPEIGVPRGDGNQSKWNDDHKGRDDYSKNGDKDDFSKHGKDDYSKHATNDDDGRKGDYSKHDGAWKEAKNDDGQPHTHHDPGEALAKFDFSHGDFGSPVRIIRVTSRPRLLRCRPTMRSNTPSARWARRITST